uniref:Bactericidal permeability-increasing protein n=1 Tax=Sinocyclocheilus anshuiensis TaxID=1608454 RepID=A0A671RZR8_9TELE
LLKQKAASYRVSQMMAVWIQNKLKSTEIPEVRGGVDIGIGTVEYVISNMQVVQCSMSGPSMEFVNGIGVSVEVSQLSLAITGSWATQFGIIHDGGSVDLAVYNIKIKTLLGLGDEAGRLSITTISCSDDVGGVHIQFHGGASFFFQPFVSAFQGQISEMIHVRVCHFFISKTDEPNQHLYLLLVIFLIVSHAIPKSFPIHLNTSQFGAFIPQLRTLYPNMEMQVLLYASKTPLFSFSSGVIDVHVPVAAKFSVVKPDGMLVPLFRLDVVSFVFGYIKLLTVRTDPLGIVLFIIIIILLCIVDYLKTGFLLPTLQDFSLINSKLLIKNGFVVIFTDVENSWTVSMKTKVQTSPNNHFNGVNLHA